MKDRTKSVIVELQHQHRRKESANLSGGDNMTRAYDGRKIARINAAKLAERAAVDNFCRHCLIAEPSGGFGFYNRILKRMRIDRARCQCYNAHVNIIAHVNNWWRYPVIRNFYRAIMLCDCGDFSVSLQKEPPSMHCLLDAGKLLTLSLFQFETQLYLYYESTYAVSPDELFPSLKAKLARWPSEGSQSRVWAEMVPVYLPARPENDSVWRDGYVCEQKRGMLLRLKPDKVSSYVFWHYQRQEEARVTPNQYLAIALHENMLFYYDELPAVEATYPGVLNTKHTPSDWDAVMEPHFQYWEDVEPIYKRKRPMTCLLSV